MYTTVYKALDHGRVRTRPLYTAVYVHSPYTGMYTVVSRVHGMYTAVYVP